MSDRPNPGSDEAIKLGCTCPVLDNAHGKGAVDGSPNTWWVSDGCPLHGRKGKQGKGNSERKGKSEKRVE